jgi:hypothetical protein
MAWQGMAGHSEEFSFFTSATFPFRPWSLPFSFSFSLSTWRMERPGRVVGMRREVYHGVSLHASESRMKNAWSCKQCFHSRLTLSDACDMCALTHPRYPVDLADRPHPKPQLPHTYIHTYIHTCMNSSTAPEGQDGRSGTALSLRYCSKFE